MGGRYIYIYILSRTASLCPMPGMDTLVNNGSVAGEEEIDYVVTSGGRVYRV